MMASRMLIRRKPGYTPEAAAVRRMMRRMARRLGIPPRKLKRKFEVGYSSTALTFRFKRERAEANLKSKPSTLPDFFNSSLGETFEGKPE